MFILNFHLTVQKKRTNIYLPLSINDDCRWPIRKHSFVPKSITVMESLVLITERIQQIFFVIMRLEPVVWKCTRISGQHRHTQVVVAVTVRHFRHQFEHICQVFFFVLKSFFLYKLSRVQTNSNKSSENNIIQCKLHDSHASVDDLDRDGPSM